MKFDYFDGICESCGGEKSIFVPHGKSTRVGLCEDCLLDEIERAKST